MRNTINFQLIIINDEILKIFNPINNMLKLK